MTLLSTAQAILTETKSTAIPTTIIGNSQSAATQVLQAMTLAITSLARDFNWQELLEVKSFSTVASTIAYDLPVDFDRFVNNTIWNSTIKWEVIGPIDSQEWRFLNDAVVASAPVGSYFRIRKNKIEIFPTPVAVENYNYEYVSNLIIESSGGAGQTEWEDDTDVPVIDEYILRLDSTWRFLKMQGKPYAEEQRVSDGAVEERISKSGARKTIFHHPDFRIIDKSRIGYPTTVVAP